MAGSAAFDWRRFGQLMEGLTIGVLLWNNTFLPVLELRFLGEMDKLLIFVSD